MRDIADAIILAAVRRAIPGVADWQVEIRDPTMDDPRPVAVVHADAAMVISLGGEVTPERVAVYAVDIGVARLLVIADGRSRGDA